VIIARVDDGAERACNAVREVPGVDQVDVHGEELTVRALAGPAVLSPVAIALDGCVVRVRDLTLREPTLDDVFLELTGGHIQQEEETRDDGDHGPSAGSGPARRLPGRLPRDRQSLDP